jgi:uncharacterized protein
MKRIQLIFAMFLISLVSVPVHAQNGEPPIPARPAEGHYVLDELDWLTGKQEADINAIVRELDNDGLTEIAVVTLDDCGSNKEAFRKSLFDTWGIGHRDDNDGLLILVCWYGGDESRRSVEQVYGPGLDRVLTSAKTDQIAQDEFVVGFRLGHPGNGLLSMVHSYDALLRESQSPTYMLTSFWESLPGWMQPALLVGLVLAAMYLINRIFPGWLRWDRENYPHDRDYGGSSGGFDGGSSSGGGGSSTRF